MRKVHLLVEDNYIESFMESLPKDKVFVIEEEFEKNKKLLNNTLEEYKDENSSVIPYVESMKDLTSWLKEREN